MSTHALTLTPRDLLFMHDARPMEASDAGLGANWPRPDHLYRAILSAFWRQWPQRDPAREGEKHTVTNHDRHKDNEFRFGALRTAGPFPCKDGTLFFPCPLDLAIDDGHHLRPMALCHADGTNIPKPLQYSFISPVLGKDTPPQWISADNYRKYLNGQPIDLDDEALSPKLFASDRNIGVAIDPESGRADDHKLYQAEYLRLENGVTMAALASCDQHAKGLEKSFDLLADLLAQNREIILGGQQGVVYVKDEPTDRFQLPALQQCPASADAPVYLRWTLLAPAVFPAIGNAPGGWLPTWVDPHDARVLLRTPPKNLPRNPGESRDQWRQRRQGDPITGATLVAARIGKPLFFSGWKVATSLDKTQAPKPTLAAVPAGSVYLFRCDNASAANALWQALNATDAKGNIVNRRSGSLGETGFGLGLCSILPKHLVPQL